MKKLFSNFSFVACACLFVLSFVLQSFGSDYKPAFDEDIPVKCRQSTLKTDYCDVGDHGFKFSCVNNTSIDDCTSKVITMIDPGN